MQTNIGTILTALLVGAELFSGGWKVKAQISFGQCLSTNPPVTLPEDTALTFTLQSPLSICSDPVGPVLFSTISIGHGTLTSPNSFANPPTFTYTPFTNYQGP